MAAMPRPLRVEYPGAIDHAMSRGGRRKDTDFGDVGRQDFLKTLAGRRRRGTTFTIREIARRLHTGSWKSLNHRLYLAGKQVAQESKTKKARK
jgi:hypothetical protein